MRRWMIMGVMAAVLAATGLAGCSSSTESAPPTTTTAPIAPCDAIRRLDAVGAGGSPNTSLKLDELRTQILGLKQIRDSVPPDVAAATDTIVQALEPLVQAGEDPVPFDKFAKVGTDPKVSAASTVITEYARTTCGVEAGTSGGTEGGAGAGGNPGGGNGPSDAGGNGGDQVSITAAQDYVKAQGGSAPWVTTLADSATWQYKANGNSFDWDVQLSDAAGGTPTLTPADALTACKALADYLGPRQAGATVTVKNLAGKTLATSEQTGTCAIP